MRPSASHQPVRPGNERTVSVRLKPPHKAWLRRLAEREATTEGRLALRELERAITERARAFLENEMKAELADLADAPFPNKENAP